MASSPPRPPRSWRPDPHSRWSALLAVGLGLLGLAPSGRGGWGGAVAAAAEVGTIGGETARLDSTWGLHLHWHGDNGNERSDDDGYGDVRSSFDLRGRWAQQTLALRFEALRFIDPPAGDVIVHSSGADYADEYVLEKLSWGWEGRSVNVAVGDSYVTFGRGLALSLRRVDELGVDTSLRGAKAELSSRYLRVQLAGGWTNAANLDPVNERLRFASCSPTMADGPSCNPLRLDPADRLAGGRLELRWPRVAHLAAEEVVLQRWGEDERVWGHGVSLELPGLPLLDGDLYGEAVWLDRPEGPDGSGVVDGRGFYGALNLYLGELSVLLEGKDYASFVLQTKLQQDPTRYTSDRTFFYNEPPSLEPLSTIAYDNVDARGGRLRLAYPVAATGTVLDASGARFVAGAAGSETEILHFYGGLEQELPHAAKLFAHGGVRWETAEGADDSRRLLHTEGKLVVPITGPHSTTLGWSLLAWRDPGVLEEHRYEQGELQLGYAWAPAWSLAVILGLDNELEEGTDMYVFWREKQQGADPPQALERARVERRTRFAALMATWYPASWLVLQGLAGSLRGGPKCIGSVCRVYPSFTGAQMMATLRY